MCKGKLEKSILYFFLVCHRVLPFVTKMVIDEKKTHILTNYQRGGRAINYDHFTEYLDINLELISEKPERIELFNFKDEKSQLIFRKSSSETDEFTNCFLDEAPLEIQVENWRKVLHSHCKNAFKKIRIRKKKVKPISPSIATLINERNTLSTAHGNQIKIELIEKEIADEKSVAQKYFSYSNS